MSFLSERTKNILNAHPPRKARDYVNTALDSRVKPELVGAFLEGLLACSHLDPNKDLLILIEKNAHNFRR